MKITEKTRKGEYGGDENIEITVTTKEKTISVSFGEGEPEDMSLGRDLNDAYSISSMIVLAYEAGKAGEELEIVYEEEEDE